MADFEPGPPLPIGFGLLLEQVRLGIARVDLEDASGKIVEAIRGIEVAGVHVDANASATDQIKINAGTG
jgi:hypothetical protein